ncbi:hypothetical protein WJX74_005140 [Apatococcus lobatus]|uniref:Uncharacterized protein n=1 Tax=Apatococcus lobatus TaxID=904363 RepID=A0AAW1SG55_9CHLO
MQPVSVNGKAIRIDAESRAGALMDVVKALTGAGSTAASNRLTKMLKKEPQLSNRSKKAIINNKGGTVWTARAPVLVEIGWCCTGREGAETIARALGEDASLVDEIEHRRHEGLESQRSRGPRRYIMEAKARVACAIKKLMDSSAHSVQHRQGGLEKYFPRVDDAAVGALVAEK